MLNLSFDAIGQLRNLYLCPVAARDIENDMQQDAIASLATDRFYLEKNLPFFFQEDEIAYLVAQTCGNISPHISKESRVMLNSFHTDEQMFHGKSIVLHFKHYTCPMKLRTF